MNGCPFVHPPPVPVNPVIVQPQPPVPPQPIKEKKTIFEKAQVIHKIKNIVGKKCKYDLECHTYKCPFEHTTVTGYSKVAEEILEKVRQFNA